MLSSSVAGIAYATIVFSIGFALGIVRVLLVTPRAGAMTAVLLEAPIMLVASWHVCRQCVRRFRVEDSLHARLIMGAVALATLLLAEIALAESILGRTLAEYLASLRSATGGVGLAAQIAFGAFPLLQSGRRSSL